METNILKLLNQMAMNQVVIMTRLKKWNGDHPADAVLDNSIKDTGTVLASVLADLRRRNP